MCVPPVKTCTFVQLTLDAPSPKIQFETHGQNVSFQNTGWSGVETDIRSEEHTSELQSHLNLVCRLLLEKKKTDWASASRTPDYPRSGTAALTVPFACSCC